ncbi:glycosyltransferase [Acetobacteroides hydrogenigenes]|uniref:Glycosyltransferase involved in cell wall biosynthesis n=1 Tax=Acetobacteroides hydrogenigenes TaxID=979970 RepID=A0A4R2EU36_9BACT|nr:glycosyltransferase [Acetobacteroides hydrogenigenes]TCN72135.1 glycosyltransferase involved in cell wall biosynthesis [Acetobacteroides hydrogenigenes]
MKILQIIYSLSSGGAERFVVDLSNELKNLGEEVYLTTIKYKNSESDTFYLHDLSSDVEIINLESKTKYSLKGFLKNYYLVYRMKPDVVHLHLNLALINFILPILFLRRKTVYVQTLHNKAENYKNKTLSFFLMKFLYSLNLVKLITISADNDKSFERVFNRKSDTVIINGRAKMQKTNLFDITNKEINKLKQTKNTIIFLHIARCAPQKNQKLLISAFNKFIENGEDAILLIIGSGYDTKEGENLKSISNNNIFYLGPKQNVADYYFLSDAFCLSSLYEGMPITLIEALACGITPISTPVSGVIDIINDGVPCYISSDFSVNSYYNALNKYILKRNNIDNKLFTRYYENNLSMDNCATKYLNFYKNCINKTKSRKTFSIFTIK